MAGYKTEIEQELVSYNPGLARRFPQTVIFEDLTEADIREVINMKLRKSRSNATDFVYGWFMNISTVEIAVRRLVKKKSFPGFGNFATVLQLYDSAVQKAGERLELEKRQIKGGMSLSDSASTARTVQLYVPGIVQVQVNLPPTDQPESVAKVPQAIPVSYTHLTLPTKA